MEQDLGIGFDDGNFGVGGIGAKLGNAERDQVRGFFFDGAFQIEARLVGGPLENADADAKAGDADRGAEIADFEDFLVEKIGDEISAR